MNTCPQSAVTVTPTTVITKIIKRSYLLISFRCNENQSGLGGFKREKNVVESKVCAVIAY